LKEHSGIARSLKTSRVPNFKHRIAEIHANSMKRLSKVEAAMILQTEPRRSNRRLG